MTSTCTCTAWRKCAACLLAKPSLQDVAGVPKLHGKRVKA